MVSKRSRHAERVDLPCWMMYAVPAIVCLSAARSRLYCISRRACTDHKQRRLPAADTSRLSPADGKLWPSYAREKRVFVPVSAMPRRVVQASSPPRTSASPAMPASIRSASPAR